jgi:hypothetical protein
MSDLIKAVWGGDKPFAIFLTDGTKINIGGNKQGCWLQIGQRQRRGVGMAEFIIQSAVNR